MPVGGGRVEQNHPECCHLQRPTRLGDDAKVHRDVSSCVRRPVLPRSGDFYDGALRPPHLEPGCCRSRSSRELQGRDHAELTTAGTAQCPEQIALVTRIAPDDPAVGENHVGLDQRVTRQPIPAAEHPQTPAECQAGDAHRWSAAEWDDDSVRVERVIDVRQTGTRTDPGSPAGADAHLIEASEVEDDPVGRRPSSKAVAAAPWHEMSGMLARPPHGSDDVGHGRALHDGARVGGIVSSERRAAGCVVPRRIGLDDVTLDRRSQPLQGVHAYRS